ncbi:hypothetical protein R1flu_001526 [Riccia fluitans]|uniref:Uncharacterized protein n=1 Tax=Riccia fluitans TaxID=41844 RepID=A0ABD1Y3J0_9MARC
MSREWSYHVARKANGAGLSRMSRSTSEVSLYFSIPQFPHSAYKLAIVFAPESGQYQVRAECCHRPRGDVGEILSRSLDQPGTIQRIHGLTVANNLQVTRVKKQIEGLRR